MRHLKYGRKLGRDTDHRKALYRNLVTSLFEHGQIITTDAKAKAIRPIAERLITLAKRGDLHARRHALGFVRKKTVAHKLFEEIVKEYKERPGGYLRIIKKGFRKGDAAPISVVQLVGREKK
jgi:large subunit ribosomal protein L17